MPYETIDDLTMRYEENGILVVEELDKKVLTKGAWATLVFKYRQWDARKDAYGPVQYSIRRYQKRNGEYRQQSKFTISSRDQATKLIDILSGWIGEDEAPTEQAAE